MVKAKKSKPEGSISLKEASNLFHNIMKASVSGNAKPKGKKKEDKNKK